MHENNDVEVFSIENGVSRFDQAATRAVEIEVYLLCGSKVDILQT